MLFVPHSMLPFLPLGLSRQDTTTSFSLTPTLLDHSLFNHVALGLLCRLTCATLVGFILDPLVPLAFLYLHVRRKLLSAETTGKGRPFEFNL
jgi:hypothetical protein